MTVESDGPDKLKDGYACYIHHSGVRTFGDINGLHPTKAVLTDYNCCCNPCMYTKTNSRRLLSEVTTDNGDIAPTGSDGLFIKHCCKCNPNLIVSRWGVVDSGDPCAPASDKIVPMPLNFMESSSGVSWAEYEGVVAGYAVKAILSNFDVGPTGEVTSPIDESGCRWIMYTGTSSGTWDSYSKATSYIDHINSTCLSVPNTAFSGLPSFEGASGTVTFENYDSVKVPFKRRADNFELAEISTVSFTYNDITGSQTYDPPSSGMSIALPSGKISPPKIDNGWEAPYVNATGGDWIEGQNPTGVVPLETECSTVPRVLCFTDFDTGQGSINKRHREFMYDPNFYPVERIEFHPSYTGIESFSTGVVLAKWDYTPVGSGSGAFPANEIEKSIYLYESYVDAVAEYSGNVSLAIASGSPRYMFVPVLEGNPYPIGKDDHVWEGGAYYSHPAIHYQDYDQLSDIQLRTEDENYYWTPADDSIFSQRRSLLLGGFTDFDGKVDYGDGLHCPCEKTAYATTIDGPLEPIEFFGFIRSGRCSCWDYYCSDKCRCLPKHFCFAYSNADLLNGTNVIGQGQATWNPDTKCWHSNYGASGDISLCIGAGGNGFVAGRAGETFNRACTVTGSNDGHTYSLSSAVTCDYVDMEFTLSNIEYDASGTPTRNSIIAYRPTFGDCDATADCDTATPCSENCGSHPESLNISISGYTLCEDGSFEGTGIYCEDSCYEEIELNFKEDIRFYATEGEGANITVECWYDGYIPCTGEQRPVEWRGNDQSLGGLILNGQRFALPTVFDSGEWTSFSQVCDPYEVVGSLLTEANYEWCCDDTKTFTRIDIHITEA